MNEQEIKQLKDLNGRIDEAIRTIVVFSFMLSERDKRFLASALGLDPEDDDDGGDID